MFSLQIRWSDWQSNQVPTSASSRLESHRTGILGVIVFCYTVNNATFQGTVVVNFSAVYFQLSAKYKWTVQTNFFKFLPPFLAVQVLKIDWIK